MQLHWAEPLFKDANVANDINFIFKRFVKYVPNFKKVGGVAGCCDFKQLQRERDYVLAQSNTMEKNTHGPQGDLVNLILFFQNKEIRLEN
jgi:hypothetical protein